MKIGYLTTFTPDEPKRAKGLGFDCLELHSTSWAGDAVFTSAGQRQQILDDLKRAKEEDGISITALAHYGPAIHLKGQALLDSFTRAVNLASASGVNVVTAIAARENPDLPVVANLPAFKAVYSGVAKIASDHGVSVAFENWPGFRGYPLRGVTMAPTPAAWDLLFDAVPSPALGLEFDPSHLYWQGIDHLAMLRNYYSRIFHVHAKDTEILRDRRDQHGIYAGEEWWTYRLPGLGEIDWRAFVGELHTLGYAGGLCIEHEDARFDPQRKDPTPAKFEQGLRVGLACLRPLVG